MSSTPLTCCSIGSATVSIDGAGAGAGIAGRHLDGRRHDVGILRHRQTEERDRADDDHQDGDDVGQDRPLDEEFRRSCASVRADLAAGCISCGSTFWPGTARSRPVTTTRSSAVMPFVDDAHVARPAGRSRPCAARPHCRHCHDQHVAAALIAAERHLRHQQRVRLARQRHAHADEIAGQQLAHWRSGRSPRTASVPVDGSTVGAT